MLTKEQLEVWLSNSDIKYNISGYSIYPLRCRYYFRMDSDFTVTYYTTKPNLRDTECPDTEALIQTQCLLWGIEYRHPNRV